MQGNSIGDAEAGCNDALGVSDLLHHCITVDLLSGH